MEEKVKPLWQEQIRDLFRHPSAIIGVVLVGFLLVVAIFADALTTIEPMVETQCQSECQFSSDDIEGCVAECREQRLEIPDYMYQDSALRSPPGTEHHPFGTDSTGKDLFAQVVHGARYTLFVAVVAVFFGFITGSLLGLLAGFYGGTIDNGIMRIMDILLSIPYLLLAIVLSFAIQQILLSLQASPGSLVLILTIWAVSIPRFARIMRGQVLAEKNREYVLASRALGASDGRLIFKTILPNVWAPMIVQATLALAEAIITAAALGFLGLGAPPEAAEWGKILATNQEEGQTYWWTVLFPGLAIIIAVLGFNLLGDGLRDTLDPRLKR